MWSPDGSRFAYFSNREGDFNLYMRAIAGGEPELLIASGDAKYPHDWSADGRHIIFGGIGRSAKSTCG